MAWTDLTWRLLDKSWNKNIKGEKEINRKI